MSAIYKIIGEDGREYGPVTAEQIRKWIAENRIESRTPIFVDGAKDWNFVGLLPEFAGCFAAGTPPPVAPPPQYGAPTPGLMPKTNSAAIAGLVFGILSVTLCWCCGGLPCNILGLVFSILALVQISERPHLYEGRALAIIGLILSVISFLFLLVALASGHANVNITTPQIN
jgi:Domain of unknown function (DUF4190)/GYF domain 2